MNVEQALQRIGTEVVKQQEQEGRCIYHVRVPNDPMVQKRWRSTINDFLLTAHQAAKGGSWSTDLSKHFFASNGSVKFLWRIILQGEPETNGIPNAKNALVMNALNALRQGVEVKSMPLVGRIDYNKGGKTKGVHDPRTAESLVASAMSTTPEEKS